MHCFIFLAQHRYGGGIFNFSDEDISQKLFKGHFYAYMHSGLPIRNESKSAALSFPRPRVLYQKTPQGARERFCLQLRTRIWKFDLRTRLWIKLMHGATCTILQNPFCRDLCIWAWVRPAKRETHRLGRSAFLEIRIEKVRHYMLQACDNCKACASVCFTMKSFLSLNFSRENCSVDDVLSQ